MGFQVDPSLYILKQKGTILATTPVHLDDILLAGTDRSIKNVKRMLHENFKLTRSEDVSHLTSFDITRNREGKSYAMNQATYVHNLVEIHNLEGALRVSTPCDNHFKDLSKNDDPLLTTDYPYCSIIGASLWVPNGIAIDITFAVNLLTLFMNNPTDIHWRAAQQILIYPKDTSKYSIILGGDDLTISGH